MTTYAVFHNQYNRYLDYTGYEESHFETSDPRWATHFDFTPCLRSIALALSIDVSDLTVVDVSHAIQAKYVIVGMIGSMNVLYLKPGGWSRSLLEATRYTDDEVQGIFNDRPIELVHTLLGGIRSPLAAFKIYKDDPTTHTKSVDLNYIAHTSPVAIECLKDIELTPTMSTVRDLLVPRSIHSVIRDPETLLIPSDRMQLVISQVRTWPFDEVQLSIAGIETPPTSIEVAVDRVATILGGLNRETN